MIFILKKNQINSKVLRSYFKEVKGVEIGKYSYGCFTNKIPKGTIIGNYCSFGPNVSIFNANHGIDWASTHPFLYNTTLGIVQLEKIRRTKLVIGNDIWIGAGVIILPSVTSIGNGAIIGAGSILTKNVEPYSIVAGNPAKLIKYRFEEKYIKILEAKKTYNFSKDEIKKNLDFMYKKELFEQIKINGEN